jgi:hypothetical protein
MSIAAAMPAISLVFVSGLEIFVPSWPPASTWTPVPSAGSRAASRMTSASLTDMSPSALDGSTVVYTVRPSFDSVALPSANGSVTLSTPSAVESDLTDSSTTALFSASAKVPVSVWKTTGLASERSSENERPMISLAASLSEPATCALLEYVVPSAWVVTPRPTRRATQTPMTSARWRAENSAMRFRRDDTCTSLVWG